MALSAVVAGLAPVSCVHDEPEPVPPVPGHVEFVVSAPDADPIAARSRAITGGSDDDNHVGELAIVLFGGTGGTYQRTIGVGRAGEPPLSRVGGDNGRWKFEIDNLADGSYTALFIANSRDEVEDFIDENPTATIAQFREGFAVARSLDKNSPWNALPGSTGYRAFPMSSREVTFTVPNTTDYAKSPVDLLRALAKINVRVDEAVENFTLTGVMVCNYATDGRLIPATAWRSGSDLLTPAEVNAGGDVAAGTGMARGEITGMDFSAAVVGNALVDEIFLYEQQAADPPAMTTGDWGANNLCLMIRGDVVLAGVTIPDALYRVDLLGAKSVGGEPRHLEIVRNYCYELVITSVTTMGDDNAFNYPPAGMEFVIDAWDATDGTPGMNINVTNGKHQLTVSRQTVVFGPSAGSQNVTVLTDHPAGWNEITGMAANSTPFSMDVTAGVWREPAVVPIEVEANYTAQIRHRRITLRAGDLYKSIDLVQLPSLGELLSSPDYAASTDITSYAGAFWRAGQTGERLIGVNPGKTWSAYAMEGGEWVVIDAKPSTDGVVRTGSTSVANAGDPVFDRTHAVESTVGWATGTTGPDGGYFRLGARNQHGPTSAAPARYATVLVVPGGPDDPSTETAEYRLLFLRQGHDADYLMRPGDGSGDGYMSSRPRAQRLSPYNLTAADFNGAGSTAHYYNVREWGNDNSRSERAFTDFPTQAGALFRWAHPEGVRAYNPVVPASGAPTDWQAASQAAAMPAWDGADPDNGGMVRNHHESCPPGWRRPIDINTWTMLDNYSPYDSEIRQSLLWNPDNSTVNNGVAGLYADGYYDRLEDPAQSGGVVNGSLSTVAYGGRLIYNPLSGASIFFPFTGGRSENGTPNGNAGNAGFYWTSSSKMYNSQRQGMALLIDRVGYGLVDPNTIHIGMANPIRCVVEPETELIPGLVPAPPGVIGIRHSDVVAIREGYKNQDDPSIHLTLRGSSTYRGTWVERNVSGSQEFAFEGGLESEPVYTVYFKWGTTVAMIGGANGTGWIPNETVMWMPAGYTRPGYAPNTVTPTGYNIENSYNIPNPDPASGAGDPCFYVNGMNPNTSSSGWITPTGPWSHNGYTGSRYPFGEGNFTGSVPWASTKAAWREGETFGGVAINGAATQDGAVWLPAAGYRSSTMEDAGTTGHYWTATAWNTTSTSATGLQGLGLRFDNQGADTVAAYGMDDYILPVRCVRQVHN